MLRNISFPPCLERSDASYFCFLGKIRHYFPLPGSPWAHHLSVDRAPVLAIGCTTSCRARGFAHTQCRRAGRRGQLLLLNSNPRSWRGSRGAFPPPPIKELSRVGGGLGLCSGPPAVVPLIPQFLGRDQPGEPAFGSWCFAMLVISR